MEGFIAQATVFLAAAVIAVPIASRLAMGSVLGYLVAGLAIGPVFGLVGETEDLLHFAEFGVVMMLFLIGLELEPRTLWNMRHKLLGLGGLQVVVTGTLVAGAGMLLGLALGTAIVVGMIFALSSTAIVLQTLTEKGLMETGGGRSTFSVLLTQDIAVIPMLAIIPLLAVKGQISISPDGSISRGAEDEAHHSISIVEGLPAWGVTGITVAAVVLVILFGRYGSRPLYRFIHAARLREMYTAFALLIVVGIAFLMNLVGISPALGTFLAGVVLASSEFRHQMESDLEPFKGLLLGLFFITVGAGIHVDTFLTEPFLILGLALGVMALKGAVLYALALIFKIRGRDRWLFTLGLAQAGEFGFVLISFALSVHALTDALAERLILVVSLSMLLTPLFFIAFEQLSSRMTEKEETPEPDEIDEQKPVIIAGIGRFGQVVNRLVQMAGIETILLDSDLSRVQLMRRFGFKGFFGDPTRHDLLVAAGLKDARVLVVAIDNKDDAVKLVRYAREQRPDIHIVARSADRVHTYRLYQAGANDIVRELFDSSLRAGRYVLENMGLTEFEAATLEQIFYRKDREALADLAKLWDPKVPVVDNKAYVERARQLDKELETELVKELDNRFKKSA